MFFALRVMDTFNEKSDLESHVRRDRKTLVLFCASWCPFCREFFSVFDGLVRKRDFDRVLRVYIDDYDNQLWDDFSIEAVPTVVLFEQGKATRRLDAQLGFGLEEETFRDWLKKT